MLLQQLVLAHHAVGKLHFRAGSTKSPDESCACVAAVARLMAEFRKTALSLEAYRAPTAKRKAARRKAGKQKPRGQHSTPVRQRPRRQRGDEILRQRTGK